MENKKIAHKFYKEQKIALLTLRGDIDLIDFMTAFVNAWSDPDYIADCKGITDCRNCNFIFDETDIVKLIGMQKNSPKAILNDWAVLVDNPKSTAAANIYHLMNSGHNMGLFSTWKAATAFIQTDIEEPEIEDVQ
ncbi:MAG: hypothetical protein A2W91_10070 [Bacteroidetes bacterium GWF2_38_335]|nr:MAG: hypothetical protein A2W91_10070 [Bacteroidetes bacterium GWF2_38_335]HBS88028.1 hypothetical protein [Bacteroidales bacterium]